MAQNTPPASFSLERAGRTPLTWYLLALSQAFWTFSGPLGVQKYDFQGTYYVHYSLFFIVYNNLFTICTLLKLYTIGYIAGSGGKKPRILVQNEPAQLHNQDGRRPAPNPEDVRGTRLAIKSRLNKKKLLFIAQNQWLVLYIKCWSHERLWSRLLSSSWVKHDHLWTGHITKSLGGGSSSCWVAQVINRCV